jgi:ribosome-associated protein
LPAVVLDANFGSQVTILPPGFLSSAPDGRPNSRNEGSRLANIEEGLRIGRRRLVIPLTELEWRFSASGGPGGQHANTANTRAEVVFDVTTSAALSAHQRTLLLERLGPSVRVVASDERSQARNRQLAMERLAQRVDDALRVERPRRPTAPTRGSKERRLRAKQLRSARKQERRPPAPEL